MSNVGDEPDSANVGVLQRMMAGVRSAFSIKAPALDDAKKQIEGVTKALGDLESALNRIQQRQHQMASGINTVMESIARSAREASGAVRGVTGVVAGVGGVPAVTTSGSTAAAAISSAEQANQRRPAGMNIADVAMGMAQSNIFRDIAMFPLRFTRDVIGENRNLALTTSAMYGGQAFATGTGTQNIMSTLAGFPGSVYGSQAELLQLFQIARQAGAMVNLSGGRGVGPTGRLTGMQTPRAAGFLQGVQQLQMMQPGVPVPELAANLGGYAAMTGSQQQGAFLTGGAFSIIGAGGRQKSIQEWAESITRWLENMRPGAKRGKPFDYGELISQYFPGSNIDAWFTANGVPPQMREYWWTYILGKTAKVPNTQSNFTIQANENDVAYQRMRATSSTTRTNFSLAGQLAGTYANREQSNRWFNDVIGQVLRDVIPSAVATGPLQFVQYLPESIEEMLFSLLEKTGLGGALVGGYIGYGGLKGAASVIGNLFGGGAIEDSMDLIRGLFGSGAGDVGDVGDWGPLGGNTTAGLHPDMRKRLGRMLHANPKLKINSGLRDRATQIKLRNKGFERVSGKPSAHTRGLAADLGPPSEYPWIVSNAKRFGLKSGISAGEPWHVGLGDPQDNESGGVGLFDELIKLLGGNASPQDATAVVGGMIPMVLNLLLGLMGRKPAPMTAQARRNLQFDPGVYGRLLKAGQYRTGGLVPSIDFGTGTGGGGGTMPPGIPGPPGEGIALAVNAAHSAGFAGENLVKIVAIGGRESGYDPMAHRTSTGRQDDWTTGDRGMWQINYVNDPALRTQGIIQTADDLKNAFTNAKAAFYLSGGSNFDAWRAGPGGFDPNGDPLFGTDVEAARAAVRAAGYIGDVDGGVSPSVRISRGGTMVFNNTFNIQSGNGGGGIDARRTATILADHLEDEMKRRMARQN